jgi:glycosyltransferase involved in cell wall biosynthesis
MVARLEACKGHKTLLEAAKILKGSGEQYRFLLVGEGSCRKDIERYAKKLGVSDWVLFCGFAEDVAPFYHVMDLNVNCSVGTETSSLALSEGMSVGIPAVASNYGGNPYMIRDGENGFLFPCGDAQALADRIREIRRDPRLYRKLSRGAKARFCRELNAERMTRNIEELYEALWENCNVHKKRGAYRRALR